MAFMYRPARAGMLATILLALSAGLSAAGESGSGTAGSRPESASLEALTPARHQQISQAEYEQFMTCFGRMESGIDAMKLVRSQQNTTEFDELISSGEGQILPGAIEFARVLGDPDLGLDTAAGKSARQAGRDIFDTHADDARALAFSVRNVLVMTRECASIFQLVAERV